MATRIITAYNLANSYQSIIILISQETLFSCLSNDVFFVEIEKVEDLSGKFVKIRCFCFFSRFLLFNVLIDR